jgi:hypothetical protein
MKYYIVSVKHTKKSEPYITLWRQNDAGYCWFKDMAGTYDEIHNGYHRSVDSIPITEALADRLFTEVFYDGKKRMAILNTPTNMRIIKAQR